MAAHWKESKYLAEQVEGSHLLDTILEKYRPKIGNDYSGYRNHCQRVYAYSIYLTENVPRSSAEATEIFEKFAIAVSFHDIGLWTANTVDYIDPSEAEAMRYLDSIDRVSWKEEISLMITRHHQILQGSLVTGSLAEIFRKADLVDFSWGWIRHGVPRSVIISVQDNFKNAGFHLRLLQRATEWFFQHPLNPAPMMRLR